MGPEPDISSEAAVFEVRAGPLAPTLRSGWVVGRAWCLSCVQTGDRARRSRRMQLFQVWAWPLVLTFRLGWVAWPGACLLADQGPSREFGRMQLSSRSGHGPLSRAQVGSEGRARVELLAPSLGSGSFCSSHCLGGSHTSTRVAGVLEVPGSGVRRDSAARVWSRCRLASQRVGPAGPGGEWSGSGMNCTGCAFRHLRPTMARWIGSAGSRAPATRCTNTRRSDEAGYPPRVR